jgi:hypothetical protein
MMSFPYGSDEINIHGTGSHEQQSSGSSIILSYLQFITHCSKHLKLVMNYKN